MRWINKYTLGIIPMGLCLLIALFCVFAAEKGVNMLLEGGFHVTPEALRNIASIFIFAGLVYTVMWFGYCLFHDWRAWDDRKQLRKALRDDESNDESNNDDTGNWYRR